MSVANNKDQKTAGRPSAKTPEVLKRLEDALIDGLTIAGACGCAGIGLRTFYDWQKDDAEFSHMVEGAKAQGQAGMEKAILKGIKQDPKRALEVAKRRYPEWQDRQRTDLAASVDLEGKLEIGKSTLLEECASDWLTWTLQWIRSLPYPDEVKRELERNCYYAVDAVSGEDRYFGDAPSETPIEDAFESYIWKLDLPMEERQRLVDQLTASLPNPPQGLLDRMREEGNLDRRYPLDFPKREAKETA